MTDRRRFAAAAALVAACGGTVPGEVGSAAAATFEPVVGKVRQGGELIGTGAPSLDGVRWADGEDHPLSEDRGKVVLVRWWTDTCPFCRNSAPAIRALSRKYGARLAVRAVYHDKVPGRTVEPAVAARRGRALGFPGLIGHDDGWTALRRWWLAGGRRRDFTSVTFLLDRRGRIRLIHTGGEFHARDHVAKGSCRYEPEQCRREFDAIDRAIAALVAEES
ncbi:MAG: TlpA family protein disulfide reductase [Planctomycetota bacterium]